MSWDPGLNELRSETEEIRRLFAFQAEAESLCRQVRVGSRARLRQKTLTFPPGLLLTLQRLRELEETQAQQDDQVQTDRFSGLRLVNILPRRLIATVFAGRCITRNLGET
jgi:predicted ATPase